MDCPKCQGSLREIGTSEGVTLDFCSACHGLWFDAGEVADYFDLSRDLPQGAAASSSTRPTSFSCPKCQGTLVEFRYHSQEPLLLDTCPDCGGIWFDRGEVPVLHRLAARLESPQSRILKTFLRLKEKDFEILGAG